MKQIGKAALWLGPWAGLAFFAWRQQTLEATLAEWVDATNQAMQAGIAKLADVAADAAGEAGRVGA